MTTTVEDSRDTPGRGPWCRTTTSDEGPFSGCPEWCQIHTVVEEEDEPNPTVFHVRRFSGDDLPAGLVAAEQTDFDGRVAAELELVVEEARGLTASECRSLAAALLDAAEWADRVEAVQQRWTR